MGIKEVETCLEKHKAVREAAVFGLPDLDLGEKVTAAVVLKDNQEASEKDLQAFCKIELANYKCPKKIHFLEKLPRNRMGKLMRGETRKLFS